MGLEMDRAQRVTVGVVLPAVFIALWMVPVALLGSDLPDPIAIHFGADGAADGSAPLWVHLMVTGAFVVISSAILVWAAWRPSSTIGVEAAVATFLGGIGSVVSAQVILANDDVARWQDAVLGSGAVWGAVFGALGASIPVALMVRHAIREVGAQTSDAVTLAPDERAAWFGRSSSWQFGAGALALVFVGTVVVIAFGGGGVATGLTLLAVGLVLVSFVSVTVSVSDAGVRVRAGLLRWPVVHLPLQEIEAARYVADFHPMRDGARLTSAAGARRSKVLALQGVGWGYRGSLRLFGAAAWVLGRGPALELDLAGGKRFLVTVQGSEEAAALLNGLVARAARARAGS